MTLLVVDEEAAHLNALRDLRLLHIPPDDRCGRLTRMAGKLLGAPRPTVFLTIGEHRWCRIEVGVRPQATPTPRGTVSHGVVSTYLGAIAPMLKARKTTSYRRAA